MSSLLFNVHINGVMREDREKIGYICVSLWDNSRNCEWKMESRVDDVCR